MYSSLDRLAARWMHFPAHPKDTEPGGEASSPQVGIDGMIDEVINETSGRLDRLFTHRLPKQGPVNA
jgi:hypothetical protein